MGVLRMLRKKAVLLAFAVVVLFFLSGCVGSSSASSSGGLYAFEDAGFEACFPGEPEKGSASGIFFNERETVFMGSDGYECMLVAKGKVPESLSDFLSGDPADEAKANNLDQTLDFLVYACGRYLGLDEIAFDGIALSNYNEASSYSGFASFSAHFDSDDGGSSEAVAHCCCGVVCNGSSIYTILAVRDGSDEALRSARSFTLLDPVDS